MSITNLKIMADRLEKMHKSKKILENEIKILTEKILKEGYSTDSFKEFKDDADLKKYKDAGVFYKDGYYYAKTTGSWLIKDMGKDLFKAFPITYKFCPLNPKTRRPYYKIPAS